MSTSRRSQRVRVGATAVLAGLLTTGALAPAAGASGSTRLTAPYEHSAAHVSAIALSTCPAVCRASADRSTGRLTVDVPFATGWAFLAPPYGTGPLEVAHAEVGGTAAPTGTATATASAEVQVRTSAAVPAATSALRLALVVGGKEVDAEALSTGTSGTVRLLGSSTAVPGPVPVRVVLSAHASPLSAGTCVRSLCPSVRAGVSLLHADVTVAAIEVKPAG